MTATTIPQTRSRRIPWLLLVVIAAGVLLISLPPLNGHAVERHGRTAKSAYCWLLSCDPDDPDDSKRYWRGVQEDGRTVHIYRLPKLAGKPTTWAVVIVGGSWLVTSFLTQHRRAVDALKERCVEAERER
jgi:glycine/D-amino acid oxidase-like deaminating enzyme